MDAYCVRCINDVHNQIGISAPMLRVKPAKKNVQLQCLENLLYDDIEYTMRISQS